MTPGAKHPLLHRGPFIAARYAELRTEAAEILRRACEGLEAADDRKLVGALVDGRRVLLEMDALWNGQARGA
jgi:hypothetical protein